MKLEQVLPQQSQRLFLAQVDSPGKVNKSMGFSLLLGHPGTQNFFQQIVALLSPGPHCPLRSAGMGGGAGI